MASSSKVAVILRTSNALIYLSYRINSQPGSAVIHVFQPFLAFVLCLYCLTVMHVQCTFPISAFVMILTGAETSVSYKRSSWSDL